MHLQPESKLKRRITTHTLPAKTDSFQTADGILEQKEEKKQYEM